MYAHGSAIESSLKGLAERRTDIFGAGNVEMRIGEKVRGSQNKLIHLLALNII